MGVTSSTSNWITTIVIDRAPLNVLTPEMHRELALVLRAFEADRNARVAVITGAGDRAFCAGDDVKRVRAPLSIEEEVSRELFPRADDSVSDSQAGWDRDVMDVERMKPVIAAIRGWCLGQGFVYACHLADIRIAGESAQFGLPEIFYGMSGAAAMSNIFRHMPRSAAMKLALSGEPIDAREALRYDLVNEVVDDENVLTRALEIAGSIARHNSLTLRAEMEALLFAERNDWRDIRHHARRLDRLQRLARTDETDVVHLAYSGRSKS